MKSILIFAALAGIAGAIAIYFVTESATGSKRNTALTDNGETFNLTE